MCLKSELWWTLSMEMCLPSDVSSTLHPKTFYGEGKPQLCRASELSVFGSAVCLKRSERFLIQNLKKFVVKPKQFPGSIAETEAGDIILWSNSLLNSAWILWPDLKQKCRKISVAAAWPGQCTLCTDISHDRYQVPPPAYVTVSHSGYWDSLSRGESNHWLWRLRILRTFYVSQESEMD